ncbi:MAG: hypothetical protein CUN56_02700 [Phototrophicales bacterium]|nr:MAG: hypothetical protein CUN56_02700 [Phototrophicales bacterium]RMG72038.1 MAG: DNA-binding response regulator [Chloroflexota bacterium]
MALATVLLIRRIKQDNLLTALERKYHVLHATSGTKALDMIEIELPDIVVLDAHSLRTSGDRITRKLKIVAPVIPLIHIRPDDSGDSAADVVMFPPVTPRRLMNSIGRFVTKRDEEVLGVGPFKINVPRRIFIVHGEETQLTPKQARLIELFMRHPGETLERKNIMEQVWKTNYMGDTRTLDVHIRWLREIMECGGKYPRVLKTVRGVGYKLEVTASNGKH